MYALVRYAINTIFLICKIVIFDNLQFCLATEECMVALDLCLFFQVQFVFILTSPLVFRIFMFISVMFFFLIYFQICWKGQLILYIFVL